MKRAGYLMERIADPDNLRLAYWKAQKGKSLREEVQRYRSRLDTELTKLHTALLSGSVEIGNYRYFKIFDPKERLICAAAFSERVLHHALMNVCHPVFERFQTDDSYATRPGKGQYAALDKAKQHTVRYRWFGKLDIRKFFDHIDHAVLRDRLIRLFKDKRLLAIFFRIIDSYETVPGRGLPIGNLTSQYLANFYLGFADHYVREVCRVPAYVRYMDDMLLWHDDKEKLKEAIGNMVSFTEQILRLDVHPPCVNTTVAGVPFLGYVLFADKVRLNRHSKKRFRQKIGQYDKKLKTGVWTQQEYARHMEPLVAFTRYADAVSLRRSLADINQGAG